MTPPKGLMRKVISKSKTGRECRILLALRIRLKALMDWTLNALRKVVFWSILMDGELSRDEVSGSEVVEESLKCSVSGMTRMRLVPTIRRSSPMIIGIQGERAINEEAIEGATSPAKRPPQPPNRNTFDLIFLSQISRFISVVSLTCWLLS